MARTVITSTTAAPVVDARRPRIVVAVLVSAMVLLAGACGGSDDADEAAASPESADGQEVDSDDGSQAGVSDDEPVEDFEAQESDFVSIWEMTRVRDMFIDNPLGHLDEAVAVAENPEGGTYPVGTVIQFIPQEAMVKRAPGYDPASNNWEFFELSVSEDGTTILNRGGSDIINQFGMSCVDCHSQADERFDMICEKNRGCEPLPLDDEFFEALQLGDPRPTDNPPAENASTAGSSSAGLATVGQR